MKTDIEAVSIDVGRQMLYFFPDRVLIYNRNGVGAVGYRELNPQVRSTRFIENGAVPHDATVVDRTCNT